MNDAKQHTNNTFTANICFENSEIDFFCDKSLNFPQHLKAAFQKKLIKPFLCDVRKYVLAS